jgi:hypothetical protein
MKKKCGWRCLVEWIVFVFAAALVVALYALVCYASMWFQFK